MLLMTCSPESMKFVAAAVMCRSKPKKSPETPDSLCSTTFGFFLFQVDFFSCKAFFNCWEEASIFINFLAFLHRVFRISLVSAIEAHTVHRSLFFNPNCASCAFVSPQELLSNEMTVESTFRIRSLPTVQQIPKFRRMSSFVFQHGVFINSDVGNNFAAAFRS